MTLNTKGCCITCRSTCAAFEDVNKQNDCPCHSHPDNVERVIENGIRDMSHPYWAKFTDLGRADWLRLFAERVAAISWDAACRKNHSAYERGVQAERKRILDIIDSLPLPAHGEPNSVWSDALYGFKMLLKSLIQLKDQSDKKL